MSETIVVDLSKFLSPLKMKEIRDIQIKMQQLDIAMSGMVYSLIFN